MTLSSKTTKRDSYQLGAQVWVSTRHSRAGTYRSSLRRMRSPVRKRCSSSQYYSKKLMRKPKLLMKKMRKKVIIQNHKPIAKLKFKLKL